jgi:predicted Rdx family selenoprotein
MEKDELCYLFIREIEFRSYQNFVILSLTFALINLPFVALKMSPEGNFRVFIDEFVVLNIKRDTTFMKRELQFNQIRQFSNKHF